MKKKFLEALVGTLAGQGRNTEEVMVVFKETSGENWAFGRGRLLHA